MMAARLALRMSLSSQNRKRRDHGENEIAYRQTPQAEPIMRDVPYASTELVAAHQAIDRGVGGEKPAECKRDLGNGFARPGEACHEELRQAGREQQDGRVLRPREPSADSLSHEARRQQEDRGE